jgi:hypothetical protein
MGHYMIRGSLATILVDQELIFKALKVTGMIWI